MYLQDTMDASVFLVGEGDPERPSLVIPLEMRDTEEARAYVQRLLRIRAPVMAPLQERARVLEEQGRTMDCAWLGYVPSTHKNEGRDFFVKVLSLEGWLLVNSTGNAYMMPERSSPAPTLGGKKRGGTEAYLCAVWDTSDGRCRKVGYTRESPASWLHTLIRYAARDRYRHRAMTETGRWLASKEGLSVSDSRYPRVSLLDKTDLYPVSEIRSKSREWAERLGAPLDEEKTEGKE